MVSTFEPSCIPRSDSVRLRNGLQRRLNGVPFHRRKSCGCDLWASRLALALLVGAQLGQVASAGALPWPIETKANRAGRAR